MTIKPILLFTALLTAALLPAQTLIPYQGYKDLFGYATEDGQVVIEPKYKGIFEILPENRFYTVLRHNGPLLALTRKGELIPIENLHDVVTEVENVRPFVRQTDTLRHLVAIVKGEKLVLRNTRTGAQTEWFNPIRNNNFYWLQVPYSSRGEERDPLQFTEGVLPVWTSPTTLNFIDTDMKLLFDRDFGAGIVADAEHFIVAEGPQKLAIADRKGTVRTPFTWSQIQPGGKTGYFIAIGPTNTNNSGRHRCGLINAGGGLVLDTIYRSIRPFGAVLIVEKGDRFGLMDYQGKTVLPITAHQIYSVAGDRYALIQDQDPATKASRAWLIDRKGQRIHSEYASQIIANHWREFPHFVFDYPGRQVICDTALQVIATLEDNDESEIVETGPWVIQRRKFRGGSGKYGLYDVDGQPLTPEFYDEMIRLYPRVYRVKSGGRFGVVNERGEEIVPGRYAAIGVFDNNRDTFFRCRQDDGSPLTYNLRGELLPGITAEDLPRLPPPIPNGFTAIWQENETGLAVVKDSLNAWGVLGDRGEWVLPPKKGVQYHALTYYLVLEVPESMAPHLWGSYPFPAKLKLHRVNQAEEPPLEVDYVQYYFLPEKTTNIAVQKKHPKLPDRKLITAYIDQKGNLLTPYHVLDGPDFLKSRNLLTITDFSDETPLRQLVVDNRGKTLYELDTLVCSLPPKKFLGVELDHLIVQKPLSGAVPLEERDSQRIKSGVLDTLWQLQIPIEYLNLRVVIMNRLFAATDSTHAGLLYDWQGNLLHDFGRRPNQRYSQKNPLLWQVGAGQHVVVSDGNTTVLLDEQNHVLRVYDLKFGGLDADTRFFTLIDREERRIWARVEDGMVYRR
ncbi:MAG: WG repeat-containing protein [Saprospiraceae bacterium]